MIESGVRHIETNKQMKNKGKTLSEHFKIKLRNHRKRQNIYP